MSDDNNKPVVSVWNPPTGYLGPDTVRNVPGSSAGAGSGDFHVYMKNRNADLDRVKRMEAEAKAKALDAEFERKRAERQAELDAKSAKKAAKRKKEKEKKKGGGKGDADRSDDGSDGRPGAGEQVMMPREDVQQPEKKQRRGLGANPDAVKAVEADLQEKTEAQ
jgi:hypothetical protein